MAEFQVKEIIGVRKTGKTTEYLVVWDNSWENASNLQKCKDLIQEFNIKSENKGKEKVVDKKSVTEEDNSDNENKPNLLGRDRPVGQKMANKELKRTKQKVSKDVAKDVAKKFRPPLKTAKKSSEEETTNNGTDKSDDAPTETDDGVDHQSEALLDISGKETDTEGEEEVKSQNKRRRL